MRTQSSCVRQGPEITGFQLKGEAGAATILFLRSPSGTRVVSPQLHSPAQRGCGQPIFAGRPAGLSPAGSGSQNAATSRTSRPVPRALVTARAVAGRVPEGVVAACRGPPALRLSRSGPRRPPGKGFPLRQRHCFRAPTKAATLVQVPSSAL